MSGLSTRSWGRLALLGALTLAISISTSCQKKAVCDDVVGSCLALTVVGQGPFDDLRTELMLPGGGKKVGTTNGNIDLPLTLRVLPPTGVSSSSVSSVTVFGIRAGADQASGSTPSGFAWPEGAHIEATVSLDGALTDGGTSDGPIQDLGAPDLTMPDLAGPPPTLRWTTETVAGTLRQELYGVWSGAANQTFAVGRAGVILNRSGTNWTQDASPTATDLHGVTGFAGIGTWAVGQNPGAWRRGATWGGDAMGLGLQPGETVWSVSAGGTAGELWAGSDNGKVWKRTGPTGGNGTWTSEQALPAGNTVFSVSYSGGTVFAVGQRGWVGVRRGNSWSNYQYTELAGSTAGRPDALYGVSAMSADFAVAVGTKGFAVRYTTGAWTPGAVKIDSGSNEFNAVWTSATGRSYAVAYNGLIVRLDANLGATQLRADLTQSLFGIFGASETDIYVVGVRNNGDALILHGIP